MIVGIGTDIIETDRINTLIEKYGQRFLDKVFTATEQKICLPAANRAQRFAARFAAKESVMKALGTGWAQGVRFKDIELPTREKEPPRIELHGVAAQRAQQLGGSRWHVSLTHIHKYAVAFVILERPDSRNHSPQQGESHRQ